MGNVKKFQKRIENFTCQNCGVEVGGDGFTNHCPKCFYSLHVDIFPGDRLEGCHGKMKPIDFEISKGGKYVIVHQCQKCEEISRDKFREKTDNFDCFLKLVEKVNLKKEKNL